MEIKRFNSQCILEIKISFVKRGYLSSLNMKLEIPTFPVPYSPFIIDKKGYHGT